MRLILLGPPGVGKGTQGIKLSEKYGLVKLSTGEIFRNAIAEGSDLGRQVASVIKAGLLVSDDIVEKIVEHKLKSDSQCICGFILDGFPRTINQGKSLTAILKKLPIDETYVINIDIDIEHLTLRLANRVTCRNCNNTFHKDQSEECTRCGSRNCYQREDDKAESIAKRLYVYRALTQPLIDYYKYDDGFIEVEGSLAIECVFSAIVEAIEAKKLAKVFLRSKITV